ncbi:hypothetical protein OHA21_04530 [Actinoplanes sp. NBC_00393]|uniref:hypothetical protein n=1 Tax=Actinoplanes sp. NBC_00393 TaxID=2975953 RepID=UPI002E1B9209
MINGPAASSPEEYEEQPTTLVPTVTAARPAPHRPRFLALSALTALMLFGGGMIIAGLLERPAEPSWATGEAADTTDRTPTIVATASDGTPTGQKPAAQTPDGQSGAPTSGTPNPGAAPTAPPSTKPSRKPKKSSAPSAKPTAEPTKTTPAEAPSPTKPAASPSPTKKPTPSQTSSSPQVVTLGSKCSTPGARAVSQLGFSVVCATRPWDDTLRWRLA